MQWHREKQVHTCNHHFSLSSLFQLLPFIITQPEARQHPVWLAFSTSYPQWTAIYCSAHSYQLPSSPLLPRLFHFKAPIKGVSSGTTFTWDKDFILKFSCTKTANNTDNGFNFGVNFHSKMSYLLFEACDALICKVITRWRRKRLKGWKVCYSSRTLFFMHYGCEMFIVWFTKQVPFKQRYKSAAYHRHRNI